MSDTLFVGSEHCFVICVLETFNLVLKIICILLGLSSGLVCAEIFGDGRHSNGVEDSRVPLAASDSSALQRFFGTLICEGRVRGTAVLLRARGPETDRFLPVLLTAGHVVTNPNGVLASDCAYEPMVSSGDRYLVNMNEALMSFSTVEGRNSNRSMLDEFSQDWMVAPIEFQLGWENYAIPFEVANEQMSQRADLADSTGLFIGYDTGLNRFMVDVECSFGRLDGGSFFGNYPLLFWDDCDSVSGSSGGVLLAMREDSPTIVGIRVGNIFDTERFPKGPGPGEPFDLNANVNLSRVIDDEILRAVQLLLE